MKRNRWWVVVVLLALVWLGWRWWRGGSGADTAEAQAEDPALIANRVWVDSKPKKHTDYIQAFLVLDAVPIGVFQKASSYDLHLEQFEHRRDRSRLQVNFPQSGKKADVRFKIRRCDDLPPFDLCLELSKNPWRGAPRKYYGMRDRGREAAVLPGVRAQLESALRPE